MLVAIALLTLGCARSVTDGTLEPRPATAALFETLAARYPSFTGSCFIGGADCARRLPLNRLRSRRGWSRRRALASPDPSRRFAAAYDLTRRGPIGRRRAARALLGDTAFVELTYSDLFYRQTIADFVYEASPDRPFRSRLGPPGSWWLRRRLRHTDAIASGVALWQLQGVYGFSAGDSLAYVAHVRRAYLATDSPAALDILMGFGRPEDRALLLERLRRERASQFVDGLEILVGLPEHQREDYWGAAWPMIRTMLLRERDYVDERFVEANFTRALYRGLRGADEPEARIITERIAALDKGRFPGLRR